MLTPEKTACKRIRDGRGDARGAAQRRGRPWWSKQGGHGRHAAPPLYFPAAHAHPTWQKNFARTAMADVEHGAQQHADSDEEIVGG